MKLFNTKIVCVACILLAIVGCRPRGVLSSSEMRDVLYDLHRADGAIQVAGYNYSHDQEVAGYYKNVLDKHGITQAEFDSSLTWYTNNPQMFNKIYPRVLERLEADLEVEEQIRQVNRDRNIAERLKGQQSMRELPDIEDITREMRNGYENPWKLWTPKEFCKKNVVIFGQLEKKQ